MTAGGGGFDEGGDDVGRAGNRDAELTVFDRRGHGGKGVTHRPERHRRRPAPDVAAGLPVSRSEAGPSAPELVPTALGRSSDEELMRRTAEGDQRAFAILYERYNGAVLSYLYRMLGNLEDVESVGQEVFLRAFKFARTYRYPQKFSTWLFTIARNLAINQARRRKRAPVRSATDLGLSGDETGDALDVAAKATADPAQREEIARLLSALDDLPTDQKEVIMMGVFQDLSYNEMEQITGTKAVTLRSRMFHGLRRLARLLGTELRSRPTGRGEADEEA